MFKNLLEVAAHPTSIFALLGIALLIFSLLNIKKIKLTTKIIVNISLMLALSIILHQIRLYHMPQGGSITLGSMIPLLFIAFRYGANVGYLTGFIYGLINLILNPFILHPVQVLFDYPLPYMALAIAGYTPKHRLIGTTIAVFIRFLCHFISGSVFFAAYAPTGTSPYLYSFIFNISYIIPELVITIILLKLLPIKILLNQMKV